MCSLCGDACLAATGCWCPASQHFLCTGCFDGWVKAQCDQGSDAHAPHDLGHVWCPHKPGPKGAGCPSDVPFTEALIVQHIRPDTLQAFIVALQTAAVTNHAAAERRRQAASALDATTAARKHIIDSILTLQCPHCHTAFCEFTDCLALKCKCGCGFCAVCMSDCGADAHAHVRSGCSFIDLGGRATASADAAAHAQNAWRMSRLAEYIAQLEPHMRRTIIQSLRKEFDDLSLSVPALSAAIATAPAAPAAAVCAAPSGFAPSMSAPPPNDWTATKVHEVAFVAVPAGCDEWHRVLAAAGDSSRHILSILRVQNPALWDAYATQRSILQRKYERGLRSGAVRVDDSAPGAGPAIVQRLWHGSGSTDPHALARSSLGFCASYCRTNVAYGHGIYFAKHASISRSHYGHAIGDGLVQIMLADVLIGAYGEAERGAVRPPVLAASHPWYRHLAQPGAEHRCDSTCPSNMRRSSPIFVLFGQGAALAYPHYIVTMHADSTATSRSAAARTPAAPFAPLGPQGRPAFGASQYSAQTDVPPAPAAMLATMLQPGFLRSSLCALSRAAASVGLPGPYAVASGAAASAQPGTAQQAEAEASTSAAQPSTAQQAFEQAAPSSAPLRAMQGGGALARGRAGAGSAAYAVMSHDSTLQSGNATALPGRHWWLDGANQDLEAALCESARMYDATGNAAVPAADRSLEAAVRESSRDECGATESDMQAVLQESSTMNVPAQSVASADGQPDSGGAASREDQAAVRESNAMSAAEEDAAALEEAQLQQALRLSQLAAAEHDT